MTKRQTPPGLKSKTLVVVRKPSGPYHCARCFGSVHTDHTSSRGASTTRDPRITLGSDSRSMLFFSATAFLRPVRRALVLRRCRLQHAQIVLQAVQPLVPEPAILLKPVVDALQRVQFDPAGAPLR